MKKGKTNLSTKECYIILHNIRSSHNVGSAFRSADAAGVDKIFLTGYTPTPIDQFGREDSMLAKTALGAHKTCRWERIKNVTDCIKNLQKIGTNIVAVEQCEDAIDYKKYKPSKKTALLFGNEVRGLSKQLIIHTDSCIEIPMRGEKESLNVSVALGIVLFRLFDR